MISEFTRRHSLSQMVAGAAGLLGTVSLLSAQDKNKLSSGLGPVVTAPATHTLLERKEEKTALGKKYFQAIQSVGANGVTSISRVHGERIDTEKDYKVFLTTTVLWYEPGKALTEPTEWVSTHSHVFTGTKGEVHGNRRHDTISSTTIYGNGSVLESAPREVRVLLELPEEIKNASFQEQMTWLENRHKGHGGMK